jgi:PIN domain nuclease of toxin-antitoxin system
MRLLLDTSPFLWWAGGHPALGRAAMREIESPANEVFVSAVTGWEIAIKRTIGKLGPVDGADADHEARSDVEWWIEQGLFEELPVTIRHGVDAGELPLVHRDPFDRLLVAQARAEGMVLVTADGAVRAYDVPVMDARA